MARWFTKHSIPVRAICPKTQSDYMRTIFDSIDRDGDGTLDIRELSTALTVYAGIGDSNETRDVVKQLFSAIDTDDSEGVDFNEFVTLMSDNAGDGGAIGSLPAFDTVVGSMGIRNLVDGFFTRHKPGAVTKQVAVETRPSSQVCRQRFCSARERQQHFDHIQRVRNAASFTTEPELMPVKAKISPRRLRPRSHRDSTSSHSSNNLPQIDSRRVSSARGFVPVRRKSTAPLSHLRPGEQNHT